MFSFQRLSHQLTLDITIVLYSYGMPFMWFTDGDNKLLHTWIRFSNSAIFYACTWAPRVRGREREKRAWTSIEIVFQNARGKCEKIVWHVAISHNSTAKLWALQNNLYQRANQIMVFFRLRNLSLPFDSISFSLPF